MSWLEMANLLFENSKSLSPRGAHLHLDTAGWLRTWTPHQNHAAEFAARHFAKHLEWPPMEPEPACQMYFRCLLAIERCIDFHAQRAKAPASPEGAREQLERLLVDCWQMEGLEWAERRYMPKGAKSARAYA